MESMNLGTEQHPTTGTEQATVQHPTTGTEQATVHPTTGTEQVTEQSEAGAEQSVTKIGKKYYNEYISSYQEYGGFDVKLMAEKQALFTHRLILSAASPYLKYLLQSVEPDEEPVVIVLDSYSFNEVKCLVDMLYNTSELKGPAYVAKIFSDLRFNNMGNDWVMPPQEKSKIKMLHEEEIKKEISLSESINNSVGMGLLEGLEDWKLAMLLPQVSFEDDNEEVMDDGEEPVYEMKNGKRLLRCEECDYVTDHGPKRLKLHVQRHHRDYDPSLRPYKCDECDFGADERAELTRHKKKKHPPPLDDVSVKNEDGDDDMGSKKLKTILKCDECSYVTDHGWSRLNLHVQRKHREFNPALKKYKCDVCENTFYERHELNRHKKLKHSPFGEQIPVVKKKKKKSIRCDECSFVTDMYKRLTIHKMVKHKVEPETGIWYECHFENCDKKYKIDMQLRDHIKNSHRDLFYCDKCSYSAKCKKMLDVHTKKVHAGVKFMCEQCGHEAPNPQALVYHIKNIHEGKKYPCQLCDFIGDTYSRLMHHKYRQHSVQSFMCEQCTSSFPDKGSLSRHVKTVHSTVLLKCNFCDFSTKFSYGLKRHKEGRHKEEMATRVKESIDSLD